MGTNCSASAVFPAPLLEFGVAARVSIVPDGRFGCDALLGVCCCGDCVLGFAMVPSPAAAGDTGSSG
ncbi:hypothetical protein, partial [Rhodococcus sp. BS-15]|uniref:hypothetical protein n=1 Tax=Rhodococcus sp. BS-15 TaxID=1304954 RepID=UPI0011AE30AE